MSRILLADLIGNQNIRTQLIIAHGASRLHNKSMGHILFSGQAGCHRKGTLILMSDGSSKRAENIKVGDRVAGPNGPRRVINLARGEDEMYKISPKKGEDFFVNGEHILHLVWSKKKTGEKLDISVKNFLQMSDYDQKALKLYRAGHTDFETEKTSITLEPYFLGLLLGDGGFADKSVGITTRDDIIVEECRKQAKKLGLFVRKEDSRGTRCPTYFLHNRKNPILRDTLSALGLRFKGSGDKFIPDRYKTGTREERLSLLAGLMDTDGHNHSGTYDYVTKSSTLATDVAFVARSLGMAAYPKLCFKRSQNGTMGAYYRMIISGHVGDIPCRLANKKIGPRKQIKSVLRTGLTVTRVSSKEKYYGFTVDGDNLYLLSDFTVTHNCGKTTTARALAALSGSPFFEINPEAVKTPEDLAQMFAKFSEVGYDPDTGEKVDIINPPIFFVDEAHRLTLKTQEFLGIAMEEYHISFVQGRGKKKRAVTAWVPEFTVVCATTKEGELSKPFRDRFKLLFVFDHYEMSEAESILKLHAGKRGIAIDSDSLAAIARRGRGTPRILVRYLERMDEARAYLERERVSIDLVEAQFELMGIDAIGLTLTDIKILKHLQEQDMPTGVDSLAVMTSIDNKTISEVNEPFLIMLGMIERTKGGRVITEAGESHLTTYGHIEAPEPEFNNSRVLKVKG